MTDIALYALTPAGARLGRSLADGLEAALFLPRRLAPAYGAEAFKGLGPLMAANFSRYKGHVFVAAVGIVVRVIAPLIAAKDLDPAVVAMDQDGRHVVSVLSGHLGGGNDLARRVAALTGGAAVITTATDTAGIEAVDLMARDRDMAIQNLEAVKHVNMALLEGGPVQLIDPENRLNPEGFLDAAPRFERRDIEVGPDAGRAAVWVTWRAQMPTDPERHLVLHPRCLSVGAGCNRGTSFEEIVGLIRSVFETHRLARASINCIATIDAKKDEAGLLAAAERLAVPLRPIPAATLARVKAPHPSEVVERHMGVSSVCEASAITASNMGRLLVPKTKSRNATAAVALET